MPVSKIDVQIDVQINPAYYSYLKDERRLQIFFGG